MGSPMKVSTASVLAIQCIISSSDMMDVGVPFMRSNGLSEEAG